MRLRLGFKTRTRRRKVTPVARRVYPIARLLLGVWLVCTIGGSSGLRAIASTDFDRDVLPILSDRCYRCHGPDEGSREADLRLDRQDDALTVVRPGAPEESELLLRIFSEDPDEVMPPPDSNLSLTADEKKRISDWIQEGASWSEHWAFSQPLETDPPQVQLDDDAVNEIDRFLLSRLEGEGLAFSPTASKEKLIRRLTFDLTGLPPTLAEIDAFVNDETEQAYETLVQRLLRSDHYGQRMASDWLDVARYSDTYGYQVDRDRFVWPWRDWVIRAFNQNMPYDQFILEQLAGDLLPNATDDQILATAFNRLHPQKVEGGSTEEEFRVEYVADRTQTFATAFLGLTLECARCHDHKYDPISQKEYYQLFAFFNNVDESGLYSFFTNSVPTPTLTLSDQAQKDQLAALAAEVDAVLRDRPAVTIPLQADLATQEAELARLLATDGEPAVEEVDFKSVAGNNKTATDSRGRPAVLLSGDDAVNLKTGNFSRYQPFSVSLSLHVTDRKERAVVYHRSRAWTDAGSRGYQLLIEDGKLSASLIHFWPGNAISVRTKQDLPINQWIDIAVVYDGSSVAQGLSIFIDGRRSTVEVVKNRLTKNITGGGGNEIAIGQRFRDRGLKGGQISAFKVFDRQLSAIEIARLHEDEETLAALMKGLAEGALSPQQHDVLEEHWVLTASNEHSAYRARLQSARESLCKKLDGQTEIMVMRELSDAKPAFVLNRGDYSDRGEVVSAETPAVFPELDKGLPRNRFGLAKWLTSGDHPLTARVAVNHFWQLIFGQGLVRTPEDFGRQGAPPTNQELLDWLARDFMNHGWNVQRLLSQMVTSRAYRQSSRVTPELLQKDPDNELLARAPSYRLPAEMLRDNLLAASGLLVDRIGGPPVKPYELAASFKASTPDRGEGLYRRSVYTYWKRTGPAPVMLALDASKRDVCRVKREKTSSPLQALAMLNGPQFVEASRALSERLINLHGEASEDKIAIDLFRTLTSRNPNQRELGVIMELYKSQRHHFLLAIDDAVKYLGHGESGSYMSMDSENSEHQINWPKNPHSFRLGSTPSNTERFGGEFGRASLFAQELTPEQVKELYERGHDEGVPENLSVTVSNRSEKHTMVIPTGLRDEEWRGHGEFRESSGIEFRDAFTAEAWVKPEGSRNGRIWDKITPGAGDGFLLDLVGGVRFICGQTVTVVRQDVPLGQWSHLVCTTNLRTGLVRLYLNGQLIGDQSPEPSGMRDESLATLAAWATVANTLINHDECVTKR